MNFETKPFLNVLFIKTLLKTRKKISIQVNLPGQFVARKTKM